MSKKVNYLSIKAMKDGSFKIKISDGFYAEEFEKIKHLYQLEDESFSYFKQDALRLVLMSSLMGYIDHFQGDVKNDYEIRFNDVSYQVLNGEIQDDDFEQYDEEDIEEDMGEGAVDIDKVTNID